MNTKAKIIFMVAIAILAVCAWVSDPGDEDVSDPRQPLEDRWIDPDDLFEFDQKRKELRERLNDSRVPRD